jgi:hypothetical protein
MTLRMVAGERSRPAPRESVREPTGSPRDDVGMDHRLEDLTRAIVEIAGVAK